MDEVLVESVELEWDDMETEDEADDIVRQVPVVSVSETPSTNQHTSCPAHHQPSSQSSNSQSIGRGRENSVASVIMMYSPDIPTASAGGTTGDGSLVTCRRAAGPSLDNYYARIETEESVKCVVSSVLFFLVLLAFFLVALLMNPEM